MFGVIRTSEDQRWYYLALGSLIVAAWAALAVWGASPFAPLLSHELLGEGTYPLAFSLAIFILGWTLMITAMMLPSSLPLIHLFHRMVETRSTHRRLLALMVLGYLTVWTLFGTLAYLGDAVLHEAVEQLPASTAISEVLVVALLLLAGVYQFTPLKHLCLEKCRSPYAFLVAHWRGRQVAHDAFRLGVRHGLFCLGCCWTLMVLMFAFGAMNLAWMLVLGVVMAAERVSRWGQPLTRVMGVALILAGGVYFITYLPR